MIFTKTYFCYNFSYDFSCFIIISLIWRITLVLIMTLFLEYILKGMCYYYKINYNFYSIYDRSYLFSCIVLSVNFYIPWFSFCLKSGSLEQRPVVDDSVLAAHLLLE